MRRISTRSRAGTVAALALTVLLFAGGADGRPPAVEWAEAQAKKVARTALDWYRRTPADERATWGGLAACAAFGLVVTLERLARSRRTRLIPQAYLDRFHTRLVEGKLDRGKSLDYCELNPSPAARIVLAAVRRWGRPAADMERGVALARQIEVDRLRRNVGTLRRIAALAPMIGLLGSLRLIGRALATAGPAWGPTVASALAPLTASVALAILSLVLYDGLVGRVEGLAGRLDRLGAEAVDAIALAAPIEAPRRKIRKEPAGPTGGSPHTSRAEIPLESD